MSEQASQETKKVVALVFLERRDSAHMSMQCQRQQERLCAALSKCGYQVIVTGTTLKAALPVLNSLKQARILTDQQLVVCVCSDARVVPVNHARCLPLSKMMHQVCIPASVRYLQGEDTAWTSVHHTNEMIVAASCVQLAAWLGRRQQSQDSSTADGESNGACTPELCASITQDPCEVFQIQAGAHARSDARGAGACTDDVRVALKGTNACPAFAYAEEARIADRVWDIIYDQGAASAAATAQPAAKKRRSSVRSDSSSSSSSSSLSTASSSPRSPPAPSPLHSSPDAKVASSARDKTVARPTKHRKEEVGQHAADQQKNQSSKRYPKLPSNPEALLAMTRQTMILEPQSELSARCQESLAKSNPQGLERLRILVGAWRSRSNSYAKEVRQMLVQAATERTVPIVQAQIKASDEYIRKLKARRKRVSVRDSKEKRLRAHEQAHDVGMRGRWSETRSHPQHAFKR